MPYHFLFQISTTEKVISDFAKKIRILKSYAPYFYEQMLSIFITSYQHTKLFFLKILRNYCEGSFGYFETGPTTKVIFFQKITSKFMKPHFVSSRFYFRKFCLFDGSCFIFLCVSGGKNC